jgi:hypothetical protein
MPKPIKSLLLNHSGKHEFVNDTPLKSDFQNNRELKNEVLKLEKSIINQFKNVSLVAPSTKTIESIILYAAADDSFSRN